MRCDKLATTHYFTGGIARSASRQYLVYSEADFEARCTEEGEILECRRGPSVPLLHAKFHTIGSTTRV